MRSTQTIQFKVTAIVVSLVALLFIANAFGYFAARRMVDSFTTVYNDRVVPMEQIKKVADGYSVKIAATVNAAQDAQITATQAQDNLAAARKSIDENWQAYVATFLVPEEVALVAKIEPAMKEINAMLDSTGTALRQNDMAALVDTKKHGIDAKFVALADLFDQLFSVQLTVSKEEFDHTPTPPSRPSAPFSPLPRCWASSSHFSRSGLWAAPSPAR
ncbi:MAG: MCP four helix bundle domain-containing protein [Hyphomicrobium sp.]